jgi:hypothetical protein
MDQVSIKYTNIFYCKTLQNLPKFGFLVWKQTIWQPWLDRKVKVWRQLRVETFFVTFWRAQIVWGVRASSTNHKLSEGWGPVQQITNCLRGECQFNKSILINWLRLIFLVLQSILDANEIKSRKTYEVVKYIETLNLSYSFLKVF